MKIVAITSIDDWMKKIKKDLKGYYPKKTIKISELAYPIQVEVDEVEGTFQIYVPKEPENTPKIEKKDKTSIYLNRFVKGVFIAIAVFLIGVLLFGCTGPRSDTMCTHSVDGEVKCLDGVKLKGIKIPDIE